jgi:iron complex outermembrane recepter protein
MFKRSTISLAVMAGLLVSGGSVAQQSAKSSRDIGFKMEEVIVTARKREENLQSVPIAIDALGEQLLIEKAIDNIEDVAKYTPSLQFQQGVLPNDTRPVIRGVNMTRGRPNVAILVDGVDISSETLTVAGGGAATNLSLLELQRVEVIKGPQSVTYGRSAFSGAVNYITKRPSASDGVTGFAELEADEHDLVKFQGGVTVPLIEDKFAMGLNLVTSDFDGYYENPNTGGDLGGIKQEGGAITFYFDDTGDFSAFFRGEYMKEEYAARPVVTRSSLVNPSSPDDFFLNGSVSTHGSNMPVPGGDRGKPEATAEQCASSAPFAYLTLGAYPCYTMLTGDVGSDVDKSELDLSANPSTGKDFEGTEVENLRVMLELDWQIGNVELISLSSYSENKTSVSEDFDGTDFALESGGPGSATSVPDYRYADFPVDLTPLDNNPNAAFTQFGINTDSGTTFDYDQISQEFRFLGETGDLEWMANVLYWAEDMEAVQNQMWWLRESADLDFFNSMLSRQYDTSCTTPGQVETCERFTTVQTGPVPLPIPITRDTEHWSFAASFVYHFSDDVRLTLEGRYLEETLDYTGLPLSVFENGFLNMPYLNPETGSTVAQVQKETVDNDAFVPRLSIDWQVNDNVFTYASAGKGFKPAGIATTGGDGDISDEHYDSEELWAYEIGVKTDLLDDSLRLNSAVFYNDYTDQQVPYFKEDEFGLSVPKMTNAGESEVYGIEIDAVYRPTVNWTLYASYTHVENKFVEFNISDSGNPSNYDKVKTGTEDGDYSGFNFPNTPEDTAAVSIRYANEFSNGVGYYAELFGNYVSKQYLDQGNNVYIPSSWVADFSVGLSSENWLVTAYLENLADEDSIRSGLGNVSFGQFGGGGQVPPFAVNLTLPQPRTFGIRARYMF